MSAINKLQCRCESQEKEGKFLECRESLVKDTCEEVHPPTTTFSLLFADWVVTTSFVSPDVAARRAPLEST